MAEKPAADLASDIYLAKILRDPALLEAIFVLLKFNKKWLDTNIKEGLRKEDDQSPIDEKPAKALIMHDRERFEDIKFWHIPSI